MPLLLEIAGVRGRRYVETVSRTASARAGIGRIGAWTVTAFFVASIVWYCTFTVFDPLKVLVSGIGTIELPDVLCLAMLLALLSSRLDKPDLVDVLSLAIGGWMLLIGAMHAYEHDAVDFVYFFRYTVRIAPCWLALPLLRRLPWRNLRFLLACGAVVAVAVAVVHLFIVLTRNIPLLLSMYYQFSTSAAGAKQLRYLAATSPFITGTPDGVPLLTSVYAACLPALVQRQYNLKSWQAVALIVICGTATLATLERSLAAVLIVFMPLLAFAACRRAGGALRLLAIPLLVLVSFGGVAAVSETDVVGRYIQRFSHFSDELSGPRNARIEDTVQGLRELAASPLTGTGLIRPRDFVTETGGDTHGLVSLGLTAGVPLILMVLLIVYETMRIGWNRRTGISIAGLFIVVQAVVLMALNTAPGFVWSRSLVPLMIGMALATSVTCRGEALAKRTAPESPRRSPAASQPRLSTGRAAFSRS